MVQHEPRYQCREDLVGKSNLKHRRIVGTDLCIVPAAELYREPLADPDAELLRDGSCGQRIIIDMGMIACDLGDRPRSGSSLYLTHERAVLCSGGCDPLRLTLCLGWNGTHSRPFSGSLPRWNIFVSWRPHSGANQR